MASLRVLKTVSIDCVVRGYHAHKDFLESCSMRTVQLCIEHLTCTTCKLVVLVNKTEFCWPGCYRYTVDGDAVTGHVPRKVSKIFNIFLSNVYVKSAWVCVNKLCGGSFYTSAMDVGMSMIDDDDELDRILENTNLDKFKLFHLLQEQLDGLS